MTIQIRSCITFCIFPEINSNVNLQKSCMLTDSQRVKLTVRHFVNYREADADYPTRLIGGSNGDSEIFTAIYRHPTAVSMLFNARLS